MKIVVKISGESLATENKIFDENNVTKYFSQFDKLIDSGYQIFLIIGGGNIIRGRDFNDRISIDRAGITATIFNAMLFHNVLKKYHYKSIIYSKVEYEFLEKYSSERVMNAAEDIIIIAGGSGKPGFSTDIAMVLVSLDIKADIALKLTAAQCVFDHNKNLYKKISYHKMITEKLFAIDHTALALAMENDLKIIIQNSDEEFSHLDRGTYISNDCKEELYNSNNFSS